MPPPAFALGGGPGQRRPLGRTRLVLAALLTVLVGVVSRANAAGPAGIDPRLGAPFTTRPRAVLGSETARIVVIEFSSFKCAHCRAFHEEVLPRLRERYLNTGKVQWVTINASNDISDQSSQVFLAGRAALQQGRYWELAASLYQTGLHPADVPAVLLATDCEDLESGLCDPAVREAVAQDFSEYAALGIRGTPTFLLRMLGRDGRWTRAIIEDIQSLDYFQRTLDGLLEKP